MKGIVLPLTGMIMIVMATLLIAILASGETQANGTVTDTTSWVVTMNHEAGVATKLAQSNIELVAKRAAYDIAQSGSITDQDEKTVSGLLADMIADNAPAGDVSSAAERTLLLSRPTIDVRDWNKAPCGGSSVESICFQLGGSQPLDITDTRINSELQAGIVLNTTVNSKFWRMDAIMRKLFVNESYRIAMVRTNLTAGDVTTGTVFQIYDGSGAAIPNCTVTTLSPGSCDSNRCLLPIKDMLNISVMCGADSTDGILTADEGPIADAVKAVLKDYYADMDFAMKVKKSGDEAGTYADVSMNITDTLTEPSYQVPLTKRQAGAGQKFVPLQFKFSKLFAFFKK